MTQVAAKVAEITAAADDAPKKILATPVETQMSYGDFATLHGTQVERLNALNARYEKLGVPLLAINPMDTLLYEDEGFDRMQEKAAREKFNFPYLQDKLQLAGKFFQAKHTPQVFVVWNEQGKRVIKYTGAIDDNGDHPELATSFITPVIEALLHNQPVKTSETESFGCKIYYRK